MPPGLNYLIITYFHNGTQVGKLDHNLQRDIAVLPTRSVYGRMAYMQPQGKTNNKQ